MSNYLLQIS